MAVALEQCLDPYTVGNSMLPFCSSFLVFQQLKFLQRHYILDHSAKKFVIGVV
jgi:hypothetical protein